MSQDSQQLRKVIPSLHSLILFEAAARYLNFSKAAKELSITQPAVSHGIRQLEMAIGHALFVRERRALSLTTQGQRLYSVVSGGFASIGQILEELTGTTRRETLVISASTAMATEWLMPRLSDFRALHPDILLELRCLDRDPDLTSNNIDVHIRLGDGNWPGHDAHLLWPEEIFAVCSPAYLENHPALERPAHVLDHRLIHYVDPYRFRLGWVEWLRASGVDVPSTLPSILHVNDSLVAQKAAEKGDGLVLGWHPVVDRALQENRLCRALSHTLRTGRHFYVVTSLPPHRRRVAGLFRDWLIAQAAL